MTTLVATVGVFLLLAAAKAQELHGTFGGDFLLFKFEFGDDTMLVTVRAAPGNPNTSFRPTSNLHVFSLGLVAMKSDEEGECYVQRFNESESELRGRVMNALSTNGEIGNILEETVSVEDLVPLNKAYYALLGDKITEFCGDYKVYVLEDVHNYLHAPQGQTDRGSDATRGRMNFGHFCLGADAIMSAMSAKLF